MSSCSYHASKESIGACVSCGKLVCKACHSEVGGKSYCPVCVEKLFAVPRAEEKPIPMPAAQEPAVTVAAAKEIPSAAKDVAPAAVTKAEPPVVAEKAVVTETPATVTAVREGISPLWWLAPAFFAVIGGIVAWFINRKQDAKTALYMLFGGIGMSILQSVLAVILIFALCVPPADRPGLKWPVTTSKPPAVTEESEWEEGDASGQATPAKRYIPPQVKRTETGTVLTDPAVELATAQVSTAGGTVTVDKPGDPLNGLEITVPAGAYTDTRTFTVSSAPITVNTFEEGVNPISPMIKVENGGGSAATSMLLKVPLQVPEGQSVIWYYYEPESGTLEAAPVVAVDKDSVTVEVTHFSEGFFSSIADALMPNVIDSGFRPGVDSWQMPNAGSHISPDGICEGMSMGAMWYYLTKPDGSDKSLFGRYDNNGEPNPPTPSLWQDDALAMRFCSVLHEDYMNHQERIPVWNPDANAGAGATDNQTPEDFWVSLRKSGGDNLTRSLFESSMLATHEPQYVSIRNPDDTGGHAMVVYKIVDGTLYIYDPNIEGGVGQIKWENGRYGTYKGAFGAPWGRVTYKSKATTIGDWNKISGFWSQVKDGTIGNNIFPAYKVLVVDDKGDKEELKDGYESTDGSLNLEFDNPQLKFSLYTADPLTMSSLTKLTAAADGKYYLKDQGETMLGIYVSDQANEWVDFKWYKVKSGAADAEVKIEAPGQQGFANDPCTFKALTKNIPKDARLEWYFAGQAGEQGTKYRDTDSVTHTFTTSGEKTIICQVVKDKVVKPLAKDTVTYKVVQPPLDIIANPPKGAVKQTCTFQLARSNPLPQDAKYTWSFGNGKSGQGEEASTVYDEAKTYTVSVTATWVSKHGKVPIQEHTTGELKYEVVDALPLKIIASPATGIAGEKTAFSIQGENIPENVAFYWEFGDANSEGNLSTEQKDGAAGHTYAKEGTYEVKVSMLDKKNPKPLAQATLRYNVEPPVTLAIAAPKEIVEGNGVANKDYVFKGSWEPGKAPDGARYTWSFGGAETHYAEKISSFVVGSFTLNLKATWKDQRGVEREAKATPLSFEIKSAAAFAIITTDKGLQDTANGLTGTKYTFLADWNPQKAPAGVSYTWTVDGVGVEDQGGKILHTFTTEGEHTVFAKAAWKDDKGNAQTGNNNLIVFMSEPKPTLLLTCTDTGIQNDKKGAAGKEYTFNLSWSPGKAPAGVTYKWFVNGNDTGKTEKTEVFTFDDENNYTLAVQADWNTPAGKHEFSIGQLIFKIETPTNFSVRCADSGLQASHKGVPDKDYRFYAFWGEGGSEPEGTIYAWFLNDEETGDTGEDINLKLSADPASASKAYTVKATAKWTDTAGNEKTASNFIKFDIGSAPTLSIKAPDEITSGKGVINKQYSFSVTANNIPAGAEYTWYSGDEAKKQGKDLKSVTNTFAAATDYVLKVEAKWTDTGGKTQTVTSPEVAFHISGAVTITLNAPADIKANKGVKGQKYQFSVTAVNIPAGAEYAWYSNDQEKIRGKDSKSGSISFSEAIDYTMRVEASWTDSSGKPQSVSSPEVTFNINDVFKVTLTAPAEVKAGKGIKGQKYSFSVTTENIPEGAEYAWYSNGQEKNRGKDLKTGNISFTEAIDYTLKVEARWTDTSGKSQSASSPAVNFRIGATASLSVIPPGDLPGGKGVPEKGYTFSAKPQGIPDNAEYTWYVNDKSLGKSSKDKSPLVKTEKEPKDYTVKAIATWKVNNQPQQAEGTYKFTTNTGTVLINGQFIDGSGTCNPAAVSQIGNLILAPVFAKVIINISKDQATTDQTVPVTINYEGGSAQGSAKVKVNCSYTGGKLNGTFNVDAVINYKDDKGKTIPIDIGYAGNITSTAIPAAPKGESVTCTLTGSVKSQMLYQLILSLGAAAAACAQSAGGTTQGGSTASMPTSDVLCTNFVSRVQFTATGSSTK